MRVELVNLNGLSQLGEIHIAKISQPARNPLLLALALNSIASDMPHKMREPDMNPNTNLTELLMSRDLERSESLSILIAIKGAAVVKGFIPPTEAQRVR